MSITKTIKAIKQTIKALQNEVEKEREIFDNYKRSVEKYKELCKHAANKQELDDALFDVSQAWNAYKTIRDNKTNVNKFKRSS